MNKAHFALLQLTIIYKQKKIILFLFMKNVKSNYFATKKWQISKPGRIACERLIREFGNVRPQQQNKYMLSSCQHIHLESSFAFERFVFYFELHTRKYFTTCQEMCSQRA